MGGYEAVLAMFGRIKIPERHKVFITLHAKSRSVDFLHRYRVTEVSREQLYIRTQNEVRTSLPKRATYEIFDIEFHRRISGCYVDIHLRSSI